MTYLHDKNIVHGRLTSVNIYIELNQRVKISLIDNDAQAIASDCHDEADMGPAGMIRRAELISFNLPMLTYLSPELVRTIHVKRRANTSDSNLNGGAQVQMNASRLSKSSDIFSFGTLLFELFEERFPFSPENRPHEVSATPSFYATHQHPLFTPTPLSATQSLLVDTFRKNWNGNIKTSAGELIYLIGSGQIDSRNKRTRKCPALVREIISACWLREPDRRTNFKQLAFA